MTARYSSSEIPSKQVAVFYAAYFGVLGVVLPFLGPFLVSRGIGAVGVGLITAAFSLTKTAYTPFFATMVDRGLWFRGVLALHVALSVAGALTLGWLESPWPVGAAVLLLGLGYGTVLPLVEAAVLERLPSAGYGSVRLWGSVGFVLLAMTSSRLLGDGGLGRFPFVVALMLAVLMLTCRPFERAARPASDLRASRLSGWVWGLLAILALHQVAHGPYYAFFSIHLEESGWSSASVGAMWSLGVLAELVAFRGGGFLERHLGLTRMLGLALALSPVRWLLLGLEPTLPVVVTAQLGHAVTFATVHLAGVQLVQQLAPAGAARYAQSLYSGLTFGLGVVAGSAAAGPVYDQLGGRGAFAAASLLSLVLALAWLPMGMKLRRHGDTKRQ